MFNIFNKRKLTDMEWMELDFFERQALLVLEEVREARKASGPEPRVAVRAIQDRLRMAGIPLRRKEDES